MTAIEAPGQKAPQPASAASAVGQDIILLGTTVAALMLLIGTSTNWLLMISEMSVQLGVSSEVAAASLILNLALVLIGMTRYRQLQAEIAQRCASEAHALRMAQSDPLTGLLNRRAIYEFGEGEIARWRAEGHIPAVMIVDIDSFKNVNDLFGHAEGDRVISIISDRLAESLPPGHMLARIGGDEFAILLPVDREHQAMFDELGERLINAVGQPVILAGVDVPISCSIGGVMDSAGTATLHMLMKRADDAMYAAKGSGRCRYCAFNDSMAADLEKREEMEVHLRRAIARNELYPVYEPLVSLKTGQPEGFEMLARWESPELGRIGPDVFVALAEEAGLIAALTEQLMRRAMDDALSWPAHISLSVNISPTQLRDPWFAQKMLKLLAETQFPADRLIMEITESALVDNLAMARSTLESLRNQGIRIALDDFGTGYSSIARLRQLPFDSVKIDRDYVTRFNRGGNASSLAVAVVQLSQSLGLPVVAEGVEDSAVADQLAALNCTTAQGRLYGDSMTGDQVRQFYASPDNAPAVAAGQ